MPELILKPSRVAAAGQPPKLIDEYVGQASTGQAGLSIAHMRSPSGWAQPRGSANSRSCCEGPVVESEDGQMTGQAGQEVHA
jgi:hypothetical protein